MLIQFFITESDNNASTKLEKVNRIYTRNGNYCKGQQRIESIQDNRHEIKQNNNEQNTYIVNISPVK